MSASARAMPQSWKTSEQSTASSAAPMRSAAAICRSFSISEVASIMLFLRRVREEGLGVAVKDFFVDFLRVAKRAPVLDQPFECERRPVPAEHHAVLHAPADFFLERGRE